MARISLHDFAPSDVNRGPWIPTSLSNNPRAGQWSSERMSKGWWQIISDFL